MRLICSPCPNMTRFDEVGRDQGLTFQALQSLRRVIEQYPDSEYARTSVLKFDLAFDHLAAKEMEIGRYYLKRGHYAAAASRFRIVVEDFQTTTHTAEALHRLVESYLALGLVEEAQSAGANPWVQLPVQRLVRVELCDVERSRSACRGAGR